MGAAKLRRSSAEVRELMLNAAQQLFRDNGFDGTSTREICLAAGVSESTFFRHFSSKRAIYEETVLKPFIEFVRSFVTEWTHSPPTPEAPERIAGLYVRGLYDLCRDHLDLIALLSGRGPHEKGTRTSVGQQVDTLVKQLGRYHAVAGREPGMDPNLSVRFAIAMVVGAAQMGEEFFGIGKNLTDEIASFVVRGAAGKSYPDRKTGENPCSGN